jgi:hypothetical protein
MASIIKTDQKTILTELAEAICTYNITEVSDLLSDNGQFAIQNDKDEIVLTNKVNFLDWLKGCTHEFLIVNKSRQPLDYTIIQCLHCVTGNPIIIFNNGKFPVFSRNQGKNEKSGLVIMLNDNKINGIELCFLVMKTENPFIYEKRCIRPGY